MRLRSLVVPVALGAAFAAPGATRHGPAELRFCAGSHNLPMSQQGEPVGFEVEVARALAGRLGVTPQFEWLEPHTESFEQAVRAGRCEVALGSLQDSSSMAGNRAVSGVALSAPYYDAGYMLVRRAGTKPARSLADVGQSRLAVERESIATFTLRQRGHRVHVLSTSAAVLDAVADGRAEYGYLWGPVAGWLLRGRAGVLVAPEFTPIDRWSFSLALRDRDSVLRRRLDRAIDASRRDGTLASIFTRYNVRFLEPGAWRDPSGAS